MPDRAAGGAVAGLLLAAGGGRRLGGHAKALLEWEGRPLVERAAAALREAGCVPVHVVLGAAEAQVRQQARLAGCVVLSNPAWASGMGSSLRAGLAVLDGTRAGAALVALVDQPGIGPAAMARVRGAYRSPRTLAAAAYGGVRGHPVLIGAAHFPAVARQATGDQGARGYLREHSAELVLVECGDIARPGGLDTPADLVGPEVRLPRNGPRPHAGTD